MANTLQNSNNPNYNAGLPTPLSYEQILSNMLSGYASAIGINDFNTGSAITSFFEIVALAVARASGDSFQILTNFSIDRATGYALQNLAIADGVIPIVASPATGNVTITDTSFQVISSQVYAGTPSPNIGSTSINISNGSSFPASGAIYIGRGTPNVEGPLSYSSITPYGGYYIFNLSTPTTKFHNIGESVILSQGGNRTIQANTIVVAPAVGTSPSVQFSLTSSAVILDGANQVSSVAVTALLPGSTGNVTANSITQFASPPFSGATVINPLPFTTGTDNETDDQLRVRIKQAQASTGLGTATAIENAVLGATTSDGSATIVSDNLVVNTNGSATLYIDDGTGYEETWAGVGLESILSDAIGGEQFFQLGTGGIQAPVAKAFLESSLTAPFDIIGGDTLAIIVGETEYQHVFATTDFMSPGSATAYEIAASVNSDTTIGFEAYTANNGANIVFRAIAESPDSLQTTTPNTSGRNAATLLGLPSSQAQTLRLYLNGAPLSKDGNVAEVFTQSQSFWSSGIVNGDTLILSVDGTSPITYTILNSDFLATGLYTSVSSTNSLASWVEVFNNKLTGVTAAISGSQISLSSNLGAQNRANITVGTSSTLVTKGMFGGTESLTSQGLASDFTLDRNTAQFELVKPLVAGDNLTAGNADTEGSVSSMAIPSGNITLASEGHVWILIDNPGTIIPTGVISNSLLSVSKPSTNVVTYTAQSSTAFSTVLPGDYVIIWSPELNPANALEGRVYSVTGQTLSMLITSAEWAAVVPQTNVTFLNGFVVLRSSLAPQKFRSIAGTKSLNQAATELQAQTPSLLITVSQEEYIVITTSTQNTNGSVLIVTSDTQGSNLSFTSGISGQTESSLIAFRDTQEYDAELPLFVQSTFSADEVGNPIDSFITSVSSAYNFSGLDPNQLISILQPYGSTPDAQPYQEYVQMVSITGNTVDITEESNLRRLRANVDRFFIANPLDFGSQDNAVVVLDNNVATETFTIPFYRDAVTNTSQASNAYTFNAYDVAAGPTTNFVTNFGTNFSFANYKVYMQAKKTLKPSPTKTALLYRATEWGRSGQYIQVGYIYPSVPNSPISSTVTVDLNTTILINLMSGTAVASTIDGTTGWNVTITSNTPSAGIDQVTYGWSGSGTSPGLTLTGGEYVNINQTTGFAAADTGIFRVSTQAGFTPTSTSFTVQAPTGTAVPQSNVLTLNPTGIVFYNSNPTTAAQINTYVNANLAGYVTSTIVLDGDTSGSGVIVLSTYEDSNFSYKTVGLLDGINWLLSSDLSGSPQFTLKNPLALPTDVGYAFNNGENIVFVPTTMLQVYELISILAVTGFSTLGTIDVSNRATMLELATDTVGSSGAIQVIGGSANSYSFPVLNSASLLNNTYQIVSASSISSASALSDQWFRLQATTAQNKQLLLGSNTTVSVVGNTPVVNQSTVSLLERTRTQRYFGKPRYHVRTQGDTFRIEKQGNLACLSWNGIGNNPVFTLSSVNFNASGGGTLNVSPVISTDNFLYTIVTGAGNFNGLSIGDLVTISGLPVSANNGTFLVTGVSDDGTELQVSNPNGLSEYSSSTYTFTGNSTAGDIYVVNGVSYTVGYTFALGVNANGTASNFGTALASLPNTTTTVTGNTVVVQSTSSVPNVTLNYIGSNVVTDSGQFTLTTNPAVGDTYTVNNTNFVAGTSFTIGANTSDTATNLAAAINSLSNILATASSNVVNVASTVSETSLMIQFKGTPSTVVTAVFVLNSNNTAGDIFTVAGVPLIAGVSFTVAGTEAGTIQNLSNAINGVSGVTSTYTSTTATVTGTMVGQNSSVAYSGTPVVTVSNGTLVGDSYTNSTFSASTGISEGDSIYIAPTNSTYTSPFSSLNQGLFRVIRNYNNSVWFENSNMVAEEITLPFNGVDLYFDTTTTFTINATDHTLLLSWTGNYTQPYLGNAQMGDVVTLNDPSVVAANTGSFMVLDSSPSLPQITSISTPPGNVFSPSGAGTYFLISSAANINKYYVWFNTGSNTDPSIGGYVGVPVSITTSLTSVQVANALGAAMTGLTGLTVSYTATSNVVTVTSTGNGPTTNATNVNVPSPFNIMITQEGTYTYLECINPSAVNQSSFSFASVNNFLCHRPQIQFSEYQATVPGDKFVISGSVLGASNAGSYTVVRVIDRDDAIVTGTLANATASLNGQVSSVNIVEGVPYTGYKQIYSIAQTPDVPTENSIVLNTSAQYESINSSANVEFTSLNKMNFSTDLVEGLDSYSYSTGLIQVANQIIYGDPRDPITYPGVGAAGADIFVKAPLALRIQVSIDVRLATGVPYAQTVSQIQSSVASLIQSNPVGQSIAISSIISVVNSINGVTSVAISSPQYSPTNDLIYLSPSEKAFILDPSVDIVVSEIGT